MKRRIKKKLNEPSDIVLSFPQWFNVFDKWRLSGSPYGEDDDDEEDAEQMSKRKQVVVEHKASTEKSKRTKESKSVKSKSIKTTFIENLFLHEHLAPVNVEPYIPPPPEPKPYPHNPNLGKPTPKLAPQNLASLATDIWHIAHVQLLDPKDNPARIHLTIHGISSDALWQSSDGLARIKALLKRKGLKGYTPIVPKEERRPLFRHPDFPEAAE